MNTPHKHADIIHAWADGAKIQYLAQDGLTWIDTDRPGWCERDAYRIKPTLLEWQQKLVSAIESGKTVQYQSFPNGWKIAQALHKSVKENLLHKYVWGDEKQSRIKPSVKIPEGFTPFDGGECPVDGNAIVHIILRKGSFNTDKACFFTWSHGGKDSDIIAYRVVKKAPVVRWQWILKENDIGLPFVTQGFYASASDAGEFYSNTTVIGKAEWTRTEFDE